MIKVCSFFSLPIESERIGRVYSIANSTPRNVYGIDGTIKCLVPEWKDVKALQEHQISEEEFTKRYRKLVVRRWREIKKWMDSLEPSDELYLCCWEREGFCHRYLVAKLLKKFRSDLKIRVT